MTRTRLECLVTFIAVASIVSIIALSGTARAGPVPEGFLGVPWGASPDDVEKAMAERHYPKDADSKPDKYIYNGLFAGERAYLTFYFVNNKLFEGCASLIDVFRDVSEGDYRALVDRHFRTFEEQLVQKYGKPAGRYPGTNEPWQPRSVTWDVQDPGGAAITITLMKNYAFKDRQVDINSRVTIAYRNNGLQKKEAQRAKDQDL